MGYSCLIRVSFKTELFENSTLLLIKMLANGSLDMLITNYSLNEQIYQGFPLLSEQLVLAVPRTLCPDEELLMAGITHEEFLKEYQSKDRKRTPVLQDPLSRFSGLPFVLLRPGNDTRSRADQLMAYYRIQPGPTYELDQTSTAYHMACSGIGAAFISDLLVLKTEPQPNMLYYRLDGSLAERSIKLFVRRNRSVTRAMEEFIHYSVQDISRYAFPK